MAEINEERFARLMARAFAEELDRRDIGSGVGERASQRWGFGDDDDMAKNDTKLQQNMNKFIDGTAEVTKAVDSLIDTIRKVDTTLLGIAKSWSKVDDAAAKFARSMGMSAAGYKAFRESAVQSASRGNIGFEFGMNAEDLMKAQADYTKAIGRNVRMTLEDKRSLAAITEVYGNDTTEILNNFEKFGVSIDDAGKHLGKMYSEAGKAGISLERYAKNVQEGLAMAQRYTFRDGLKGMEAMAKRASAIRMDMSQVSSFADKFSNIEDAIKNSAQLQVLGGPFASGADALGLLSDSLTDMEGIEKRMEKFTENIGVFNKTTGEVDISAFDMQRLKQYANVTGQDFGKVVEQTRRQAMRGELEASITSSSKNFSDDMKELIMNLGTFKDGKAGVSIGDEFKTIDELTNDDLDALRTEQHTDTENIKQIAKDVRGLLELREAVGKQYDTQAARYVGGWIGKMMRGVTEWFTGKGEGGRRALSLVHGGKSALELAGLFFAGRGVYRSVRRMGQNLKSIKNGGVGTMGESMHSIRGIFGKGGGAASRMSAGRGLFSAGGGTAAGGATNMASSAKNAAGAAKSLRTGKLAAETVRKTKQVSNLVKAGKGAKVLSSGFKAAGKKIPIAGALIAAGFEAYENKDKFKDRATRGSAIGKTAGAGIGAAIGAGLGSVIGPLGTVIGGFVGEKVGKFIGGTIGKIQDRRVTKNRAIIDSQLKKQGIERKGDYSVSVMKDIDKALQTGKMTDKLRRKLQAQGDQDIVDQINKVKENKKEKKKEKFKKAAEFLGLGKKKEKVKKNFDKAMFNVKNAYFNGVRAGAGIGVGTSIGASSLGISRAKKFVPKKIKAIGDKLSSIGPLKTLLKGKKEKGGSRELSTFERLKRKAKNLGGGYGGGVSGPIDVNINGVIRLEGANGQGVDLMAEIKRNPVLLQKLTEEIVKNMNVRKNGAYIEDRANGDNFV